MNIVGYLSNRIRTACGVLANELWRCQGCTCLLVFESVKNTNALHSHFIASHFISSRCVRLIAALNHHLSQLNGRISTYTDGSTPPLSLHGIRYVLCSVWGEGRSRSMFFISVLSFTHLTDPLHLAYTTPSRSLLAAGPAASCLRSGHRSGPRPFPILAPRVVS